MSDAPVPGHRADPATTILNASGRGSRTAGPIAPPALALHLWGVRGSVPAPGVATARYGGNTPCVELRAGDGRRLVLDAGTGLRALGDAMATEDGSAGVNAAARDLSMLITHGHSDHVHGLPFFAPLTRGRAAVTLYAGPACAVGVELGVRALLQPPLFPTADGLLTRLRVAVVDPASDAAIGGFAVRAVPVAHPGGACGFRVRDPATGRAVAYIPDNELAALAGAQHQRDAVLGALAGVDVLVHDATYLPEELPAFRGWGHSSYAEAVQLASDAGVPRLVLFHHHPARDDAAVDRLTEGARRLAGGAGPDVVAAVEGAVVAI